MAQTDWTQVDLIGGKQGAPTIVFPGCFANEAIADSSQSSGTA
jgi:hypothetical protein